MTFTNTLPSVAILLADSGGGHRSAACSLAEALDGQAQVSFVNLLDDVAPFPFNRFSEIYGPLVNTTPWFYHLVYRTFASRRRLELTERTVYPFVRRRVALALAASRPDLVISVHPLQTSVPLRALRAAGSRAPFITVVTDPVSAPAAWFCPEVDLCIVATDEVRASALAAGLRPGQVRVIGLPVRRAFCTVRDRPKPDARGRLGLDPTLPLVLVTGGGAGIGRTLPVAQAVAGQLATPWRGSLASSGQDGASTSQTPAQIAIIAGRNLALLRHLRAEPWPIPVTVLGFVENMADWLAAADLLITKAGPGTLAEAACVGVPVIVTDFVPGQEEGNVTWVERSGFGRFVRQPQQIAALVSRWLRPDNPILAEMAVRARAAAWPEAAAQIADAVLALCRRATM